MTERKYFHIHSDGHCEKISKDKYFEIVVKQRNWSNRKLVASVYGDEITFHKGKNHIFLKKEWLKQILEAPQK